jgi:hypothetical protein
MAKFEQFTNNATTTLASSMTGVQTTCSVSSATEFPTDGNFRVLIGDELCLVTAVSGTTFTIIRAVENTVASTHDAADPVTLIVTKESFLRMAADHIPLFGLETVPGPVNSLTDTNGAAVASTDFTWTNQGTSSVADLTNAIRMTAQTGTGANVRVLSKSAPSTPYRIYACIHPQLSIGTGRNHCGLVFRESGTGKLKTLSCGTDGGVTDEENTLGTGEYTNPTTFSAWSFDNVWNWSTQQFWMYIDDDGTNISFGVSHNGLVFTEIESELRGAFFTTAPNEVGFFMNVNDATIVQSFVISHWSEQ